MADATEQELLEDLLDRVADALDLDCEIEVVEEDGELRGTLHGADLGLFIGRHGQTIDAVQHLAQRMLAAAAGEPRRVVIDAEGYRARRQEALERQADEAADEAVRTGSPVTLDAMTAPERRLVHEYLRDRPDVDTHSEGEEPDRHLVVEPAR
ncbi:MAG: RNA-binding protein Jag [uncultured Thermoleophilia bacterium]|uniref:RNA-binding protein Jag n=1 Tax=uncultured Thermoleophilia bacterium TaxID=1497501 RepID=A0A6J4UQJ0_9ACTN|nr:MAG: RNA-binding protein Jag [uncultured Thermoleophilia bacterium]